MHHNGGNGAAIFQIVAHKLRVKVLRKNCPNMFYATPCTQSWCRNMTFIVKQEQAAESL